MRLTQNRTGRASYDFLYAAWKSASFIFWLPQEIHESVRLGEKYICVTCGTQYPESATKPERCPICGDERQYVGWGGQQWTTLEEMRAGGKFKNKLREEEPGLLSIITRPEFAIGERAFLLQTPEGNALWDCITFIDDDTVNAVKKLGGLKFIAISHPHYYTSMNEWSHAFGVPIYLHEFDRRWVMNPSPDIVFWKGESTPTPLKGVTLVNLGGHFDGGTVLHWQGGAGGRSVVLSGDIIQVVPDRRWASFMYSYPNLIPLSEEKVGRVADRIAKFRFDRVYAAFEGREIKKDGYEAVQRSALRYMQHIRGRTIAETIG